MLTSASMLHRVVAIALNTYRESVRARILLGLAGVAFAVAFYALIVGTWTLRHAPRVVSDIGSASISLFSVAVAMPPLMLHPAPECPATMTLDRSIVAVPASRALVRSRKLSRSKAGQLVTAFPMAT